MRLFNLYLPEYSFGKTLAINLIEKVNIDLLLFHYRNHSKVYILQFGEKGRIMNSFETLKETDTIKNVLRRRKCKEMKRWNAMKKHQLLPVK